VSRESRVAFYFSVAAPLLTLNAAHLLALARTRSKGFGSGNFFLSYPLPFLLRTRATESNFNGWYIVLNAREIAVLAPFSFSLSHPRQVALATPSYPVLSLCLSAHRCDLYSGVATRIVSRFFSLLSRMLAINPSGSRAEIIPARKRIRCRLKGDLLIRRAH